MAAIEEDVEVDEGLVAVARRLKRWKKQRGEVWAAELARKNEEAEAEKQRESEERAATERAIAEAEAEERGTEAVKAAEKRARLARACLVVVSDSNDDGEAAAATTTTTTGAAEPGAAAAAMTTVSLEVAGLHADEVATVEVEVGEVGNGHRTVWGTDGVTPVGVIKTGAASARAGGRRVVVVVPPVLEHWVGVRMTATPHGFSGWVEVEKRATEGRGRRRVGVGADIELRAARQPGDKVSREFGILRFKFLIQ